MSHATKWYSTQNKNHLVDFETALFGGISPDGGLYMPQSFPFYDPRELQGKTIPEIGFAILRPWLSDGDLSDDELKDIADSALNFPFPIRKIADTYVLELFHGPTMAFKDVAARVLAGMMEVFLKKSKNRMTLLVATSGDTGGAVAQAFGGKEQIDVVILYPKDGVSRVQEHQLTHVKGNVTPLVVQGSFDDCQAFVKRAFTDIHLKHCNLSTANSINIGRLLPQMIYYAYTIAQLDVNPLRFVVPSGNMGNVCAGLMAKRSGIPINQFLIACNANDPVVAYMNTGEYNPKKTVKTLSNAMDIGAPSNFERIADLYLNNFDKLRSDASAIAISDDETIQTIQEVYTKHEYLLDPHTAVAWCASQKAKSPNVTDVIVSTAAPEKFAEEIARATGIRKDSFMEENTSAIITPNEIASYDELQKLLTELANRT